LKTWVAAQWNPARKGMRVNLRGTSGALKARRSKAQGEGREAAEALGWNDQNQVL